MSQQSAVAIQGNEVVKTILSRRSVRVFHQKKNVESEKIQALLECAFAAPSARNIQPCHLVVIDDASMLEKIGAVHQHTNMVAGAPLALGVCVDVAGYEKKHNLTDGTWMEDCSCVMENVLVAAKALGLDGVWLQIVNRPEREEGVSRLLKLPEGVKLFALAIVGYGAALMAPHSGVDNARLHKNVW
jgi:nitroreductase